MRVCKSRFTPDLTNGKDVDFSVGETVTYTDPRGGEGCVEITSELMEGNGGNLGYEAKCDAFGAFFMSAERVTNWEGKT